MTVNLFEKGGILWETRAEKRIRRKVKSRRLANRRKRRRVNISKLYPFKNMVGFVSAKSTMPDGMKINGFYFGFHVRVHMTLSSMSGHSAKTKVIQWRFGLMPMPVQR
ncbi:hypothetical protein [Candidatus Nitronereus thalassa]|uniref:Uncharacterized protein n=1 Tax=Candidatus Nitronereus thalassa TaxID=3020898 RepID=A0ABU3KC17_9BACT|nr:hypothetical protein [Candidatus Nitronereus thalassa]MDT7044060.1 hypothetical protein [Candidatus Nitronereus thalassa]